MRRAFLSVAAACLFAAAPALAALSPGAVAPDFAAKGARAGKPISVHLQDALKKGPVVLYFFPAAFTGGCNAEAHAFAEAVPSFTKAGATVIGMTAGNVDQLEAFSSQMCAGKFAVAAASPAVVGSYDVQLKKPDGSASGMTRRTSYVIGRNGRVAFVHDDLNPAEHVRLTLEAVQKLRR
ncbi:peroxiredoxin [Sphingomonas aerophila]|jgi:peroxiredoxin Q/BCP|uniref:thioredoxin-dependent peroxiredoxin n=1 Tax=Sphingomonas aerophila TaxID=1344948 RepID=A0A7W9ESY5_9SPHN|nr:redoxin domain-containing protein [Sphingomonas aerophila]MBB5713614.1 peroxiredoxin [Sphingomonas aerophila]